MKYLQSKTYPPQLDPLWGIRIYPRMPSPYASLIMRLSLELHDPLHDILNVNLFIPLYLK
jgi:hypothetical protein